MDYTIIADIDGTICPIKGAEETYADLKPFPEVVDRLRQFKKAGARIILQTSRSMRTYEGNLGLINANTAPVLLEWLKKWDIPYDEILYGKPWAGKHGIYVDDRAVRPDEFLKLTPEEMEELCKSSSDYENIASNYVLYTKGKEIRLMEKPARKDGKTIGFTSVVGDLLHAGHALMLDECKLYCDFLYVGIITDPTKDRPWKNKPVQSLFERYAQLAAHRAVDEVVPLESEADLDLALRSLPIDVRFVGEDYLGKDFTGKETCERLGIKIIYNNRAHGLSSTELRERIANGEIHSSNPVV